MLVLLAVAMGSTVYLACSGDGSDGPMESTDYAAYAGDGGDGGSGTPTRTTTHPRDAAPDRANPDDDGDASDPPSTVN